MCANSRQESSSVERNRVAWNQIAEAGDELYVAATSEQIEKARRGEFRIIITPTKPVPMTWLTPLEGRDVLCLAAGGGQQAPLLAAAGANVTVVDLSDRQLHRDRAIADRENLDIRTVVGDMRDLSEFDEHSFDLVLNPTSTCYCPDVEAIWQECYRVLRTEGQLVAGFINPVHYLFDAVNLEKNKFRVRHRIPYRDDDLPEEERLSILGDRPLEYGHSLESLLGHQMKCGFELTGFYEDRWGDEDILSDHIDVFIATRAVKPRRGCQTKEALM